MDTVNAVKTDTAKLTLKGQEYELPILVGSENEVAIDINHLRNTTGAITYDNGYGNTGSCFSAITFIDGEKGILRYRGYPIEELAEKSNFVEVCYLLIFGHLPDKKELDNFLYKLTHHSLIHEDMKKFFEGFPPSAHPMGILSSMVNSLSAFYPENGYEVDVELNIVRLLAKDKNYCCFFLQEIHRPAVHLSAGMISAILPIFYT